MRAFREIQNLIVSKHFKLSISDPFLDFSFKKLKKLYSTKDIENKKSFKLSPKAIETLRHCFPNIRKLVIDRFSVKCECNERVKYCEQCYQKFIEHFSYLNESLIVSNLNFNRSGPHHRIIWKLIFKK